MTNAINLAALNAFRAIDGLAPFADFRKARHMPMLDAYEVEYVAAATSIAKKAKKNAPKALTYKQLPHGVPSTIESPVAFVHGFLNANPKMKRKDAVAALIGTGINFSTARTQYQVWFKNQHAVAEAGKEGDAE